MKKFYLPVILGLAHGVNDCSAGMLLGNLAGSVSIYGAGMLVFITLKPKLFAAVK